MRRSYFADDFLNLRNRLDQLASEAFEDPYRRRGPRGDRGEAVAQPIPLDIYATDDAIVLLAAVPGMQPADLDLTIHQDTVTLTGTVRDVIDADEAKGATWYLQELGSGPYRRSVTVPVPVDADRAAATVTHGVLRVVLPKVKQAQPRKIRITGESQPEAIETGEPRDQEPG